MSKNDINAKTDLYLTADGKAVKQGEGGTSLLARKGRPIPPRYHDLVTSGGSAKSTKKEAPKAADKAAPKAKNKTKK